MANLPALHTLTAGLTAAHASERHQYRRPTPQRSAAAHWEEGAAAVLARPWDQSACCQGLSRAPKSKGCRRRHHTVCKCMLRRQAGWAGQTGQAQRRRMEVLQRRRGQQHAGFLLQSLAEHPSCIARGLSDAVRVTHQMQAQALPACRLPPSHPHAPRVSDEV